MGGLPNKGAKGAKKREKKKGGGNDRTEIMRRASPILANFGVLSGHLSLRFTSSLLSL